MANRVGVVERDEIERIGRLAALGAGGCSVVDAASPDDAATWGDRAWMRFDVLLFGVTADTTTWDRFACIHTALLAHQANPNLRIIGLYGSGVRPLVLRRMIDAGMHRTWPAHRARTIDDLVGLISPGSHEADAPLRIGYQVRGAVVGQRSDPTSVLAHVIENDLADAFEHAETQADTGLSRRQIIRLRRTISDLGQLGVPSGFATGGPDVDRSLPSWRACVDYVNRARGFEPGQIDAPSSRRSEMLAIA